MAVFTVDGASELYYDNSKKFETQTSGVVIHEDTDKTIRFTGGIGEIGNVTGFQATNTAGSAIVDFGMRGTTLRFATGSAERMRIDSSGRVGIGVSDPKKDLHVDNTVLLTGTLFQARRLYSNKSNLLDNLFVDGILLVVCRFD